MEDNVSHRFRKELEKTIGPKLKEVGFLKKGAQWRRYSDEVIEVIILQGSQWSARRYLNAGIYIRALGRKANPNEADCHVVTHGFASDTEPGLDPGKGVDLPAKAESVCNRIMSDCVPTLTLWRKLEEAAPAYFTGKLWARVNLEGEAHLRSLLSA